MGSLIVNALGNALTYQQVEDLAARNQRMVQNLTAIQEISRGLLTTVQEERLLEIILQGLIQEKGLGFDRAVILMVDEAAQVLQGVRGARRSPVGRPPPLAEALLKPLADEVPATEWQVPLQPSMGALSMAVLQMRPYHIHQREPEALGAVYSHFDAKEFFVVPLVVKDRATGIILVDNQASSRPLEAEPLHALPC